MKTCSVLNTQCGELSAGKNKLFQKTRAGSLSSSAKKRKLLTASFISHFPFCYPFSKQSKNLFENNLLLQCHLKCSFCVLCVCALSWVRLFVTAPHPPPQTVAHQAPLSLEFSRQECWRGLPFPSPRNLPYPGIEPMSPALAGGFFTTEPPGKSIIVS